MTFIVGKDGTVYQKDLGEKTADVALAMTGFNPSRRLDAGHAEHRHRIARQAVRMGVIARDSERRTCRLAR